MRYFIVLFSTVIFTACTITLPHISEYRVAPKLQYETLESQCKEKTIKVSQAFSADSLMTQKMKYAQGGFREYAFSESEWAQSPNRAITKEILKSVRDPKLFKTVQGYKSRSKSDYILESSIEEFLQYFDENAKSSYVKVSLTFTLVNAKSLDVIDSISLEKRVDVKEMNAKGGVVSLNKALADILVEKNRWLSEVCR